MPTLLLINRADTRVDFVWLRRLENYAPTVASNAFRGSEHHQPGNDGSLREYPMLWQPMMCAFATLEVCRSLRSAF